MITTRHTQPFLASSFFVSVLLRSVFSRVQMMMERKKSVSKERYQLNWFDTLDKSTTLEGAVLVEYAKYIIPHIMPCYAIPCNATP